MAAIDKAAIAWTIAIVAVGGGIASIGGQFQSPVAPVQTAPLVIEKESAATTQPTLSKATMPGWDRIESVQDPGVGHEFHQLAVILPPSDKVYSGTITYDASEPIQLVSLNGPLGPGEDSQQPIWTPDGKTKFELTLVDQKSAKGTWEFEGNALALHTMKTTKFIADYKLDYKESAAHTVTSGSPADGPSGMFDSSLLIGGNSFEHTFDSSGSVDYFCMVHPWMTGNVQVS